MDYFARGLTEYKKRPDKLNDLMPWVLLAAPGVIVNKNGSLQRTYAYRGPDMQSYSEESIEVLANQINGVLKRLEGGWVIYTEAYRDLSHKYPESQIEDWPDPISYLIDHERKLLYNKADFFESKYYMTFCFLPETDQAAKLEKIFIEKGIEKNQKRFSEILQAFQNKLYEVTDVLKDILPEFKPLNDDETLSYLYSTINDNQVNIKTPEKPIYLDCLLTVTSLIGGFEPKLGRHHMRVLTIMNYPEFGSPNLLNAINEAGFGYRWVTRFICMDREEGLKEIKKYTKLWGAGRSSMMSYVKQMMMPEQPVKEDQDAARKESDSEQAYGELQSGQTMYGFCCQTIVLMDKDIKQVELKLRETERIINGLGLVCKRETINAVDAWLGTVPCIPNANIRRPLLSTENLACIMPLSNSWTGPDTNKHLNGPPLFYALTGGQTPFRFVHHADNADVGHTIIVGPTGSGKSVLLGFLAAQFRRYKDAQVYFFDKGGSVKCLTAGVGGHYYEINSDKPDSLSFQPLARINEKQERQWASDWIASILIRENVEVNPVVNKHIWEALNMMEVTPCEQRTMTLFKAHLSARDPALGAAVERYTQTGTYGKIMDGDRDFADDSNWIAFEMEYLMNFKNLVPTALAYMFHILEKKFTGKPTLLILDEAWVFLDDPYFVEKIKDWLQTLRKYNVAVIFATPGLADIVDSEIAATIMGQCPTRIFLPNKKALEESQFELYRKLNLSDVQIRILAEAIPKRHYYIVQPNGNRLIDLQMIPFGLAFCGTTSKEDQKYLDKILQEKETFLGNFFKWKNMGWVMDEYGDYFKER